MLCETADYSDLVKHRSLLYTPQTVDWVIIFKLHRNSHCSWTMQWKEADFKGRTLNKE